jgi:hypothetical protein
MKSFILLGIIAFGLTSPAVELGASRDTIIAELGEPSGTLQRDEKEVLIFPMGTVTLHNGEVVAADLSPRYAQEADARAAEAAKIRAARQVEQEKEKILYPENHVVQIDCAYNKIEDWSILPEFIRPAQGKYEYDVYIPDGYHESVRRFYDCLLLESPALWNSVKERIRAEKWMVLILHDATGEHIGRTLNANFLAAFDDAAERFRINKEHIFLAGRVPCAIFSTLRPVAGIILQEPDFSGFERSGFSPDFLRNNRNLRAYALLGNQDHTNTVTQARFIMGRIPMHHIGVYEGQTEIMPPALADNALDWMKMEYRIP